MEGTTQDLASEPKAVERAQARFTSGTQEGLICVICQQPHTITHLYAASCSRPETMDVVGSALGGTGD